MLHRAHDQPFHQRAHHEGNHQRPGKSHPIGQARLDHRQRNEGGKRRHFPLREIHVMCRLVDHHNRQRDRGINAPCRDAGCKLQEKGFHPSISQIGTANGLILPDFGSGPRHDDAAGFKQIGMIGQIKR